MGLEVREGSAWLELGWEQRPGMATSGDYTPPAGKARAKSAPPRACVGSLSLLLYLARRSGQKWPESCPHLCHLSPHEGLIARLLVTPMVLSYKWGNQGPGQLSPTSQSHPGGQA